MSEYKSKIVYSIDVEGADESVAELGNILTETRTAIGLVTSLDYTFMSFQQTAQRFDLMNFIRTVLSTISLIENLIRVTQLAEASQLAYNAALIMGRLLEGPTGWAILATAAAGVAVGVTELTRPRESGSAKLTAEERRHREAYRAVVP